MAVEKIVIEVSGKDDLNSTIKDVEKLGAADAANAATFKKTNEEYKRASIEREKRIKEETQDLNELRQAKKKAFSVEDIDAYNNRIRETEKRIETLKDKTGKVGSFMKSQFAAVGATIAGAFAVTQLISFGKEAVNLAAKGEGIRRAFAALNQADLLKNLQTATRNTVADIDLMAAAVKANNFKIPLEDLARYFKFAQQRARETGESVDYLVESIVLGIGRKSPLILDNLGISAVELRTKLKGIGTETATVGQISQAVGQIIDEELGKQGVLLDTTADKLARLETGWKNFSEAAGVALIDVADFLGNLEVGAGIGDLGLGDAIAAEKKKIDENIAAIMNSSIDAIKRRTDAAKNLENASKEEIDTVGVLLERIKALQEQYKDVSTPEQYAAITAKIKTVQEQLEKIIGKTTDKIKEQKKELDKPTKIGIAGVEVDDADFIAKQKEIADAKMQSDKDVADYEAGLRAEHKKEVQKEAKFEISEAERVAREKEQIAQDEADAKKLIQERLIQATTQLMAMAVEFQLAAKQRETDYELNLLQEQYDARAISEEQYNSKRRAILKDQAQAQKEAAIIQATISTANAVIQAYSESALAGPVLAAIAAAVGIAQIAAISATPIPQFEKGGKIGGKRHKDGGTFIEAEKDEFVINRKAAQKIGFDNLELLNKGIVPVKLLKQGLYDQRNKSFETNMMKVFGSSDFDTYPIEKELRKSRKNDTELTHLLIKQLSKGQQKRGSYA